ncbi:hypothetical protein ES703_118304 [subsurface metagenome]
MLTVEKLYDFSDMTASLLLEQSGEGGGVVGFEQELNLLQ